MEQQLYSVLEGAAIIGVGRSSMCELIARGEIESFKIGALRKIPGDAIADYIKRQRDAARQASPAGG